jgi:hypothetical protein
MEAGDLSETWEESLGEHEGNRLGAYRKRNSLGSDRARDLGVDAMTSGKPPSAKSDRIISDTETKAGEMTPRGESE